MSATRVRPTAEERARRVSMRERTVYRLPTDMRIEAEDAMWTVVDPMKLVTHWNPEEFPENGVYVVNGRKILVVRAKYDHGIYLVGADSYLKTESGLFAVGDMSSNIEDSRQFSAAGFTYVAYDQNGFTGAVYVDTNNMFCEDEH